MLLLSHLGRVSLLRQGEARTKLTKREGSKPLAKIDGSLKRLASNKTANKATGKSITSTVGVNNLRSVNGTNGETLGGGLGTSLKLVSSDNNGVIKTLGDDNNTRASSVSLGENSNGLGNSLNIGGLDIVRLSVGKSLRLVTNKVVPVGGSLVKGLLEELRKERSRQVHGEDLVSLGSVLTQSKDSRGRNSEMETTDVENLGLLDKLPVLGLQKMLGLVVVGSSEISDERTVGTVDQGSALTGGDVIVNEVVGVDTSNFVSLEQLLGELVLTNGTKVDNRVLRKNVLSTTGSVLSSTTGNEGNIGELDNLIKDGEVLILDENSIVLLKVILVKVLLVTVKAC